MKIKIAHIVEDMGMGGIERVIESLLFACNKFKFQMVLLCLSRGGVIADSIRSKGGAVDILGIKNYYNPSSIIRCAKWLKINRINIIHTHAHPAGYLGRMAGIISGNIGIIHHVHTVPVDMKVRHHYKESILGLFTDKILCVSNAVRSYILDHQRLNKQKVEVVYNGISEPDTIGLNIDNLKMKMGLSGCYPLIGITASLTENKGHRYLLEAFRNVTLQYPHARLLIIGDGPEKQNLIDMSEKLRIKNEVIFFGQVENIFPLIACIDIFVLPTIYREGLPMAIVEAMAMSKPIVATSLPGIIEVVEDGQSGILVPPCDVDALTSAILRLSDDRELALAFGRKGREIYLKKFTINQMVKRLESIYIDVAKARGII